jgi:HD-like signal output (HDOD) protein
MTNASIPKLDLKRIIPLAQLPGIPQSAVRLMEISQNPDNGPAEIAVPIEVDQGLTGQVLRFVNSSYFGFARKISNVRMAVGLVGVHAITNFILCNAIFSLMTHHRCGPFDLICLWQDSLRRALFARTLAKLLCINDAEDVFAAALLQDMAIPILAKESPRSYEKLLDSRKQGQIRLSSLENAAFGWTHGQVAGMIAHHWKLPGVLINLIGNHYEIEKFAGKPGVASDKVTVAISALLPTVADPVWFECRQFELYYNKLFPDNNHTIVELLEHTDKEFALFAPIMKLPTPAKSLVDQYNEVTASTMSTT